MKKSLSLSAVLLCALSAGAAGSEASDTTNVLDEFVVVETAAKAPVPLLPLDVRIIGSEVIDNSTESNLLPVLENRIPGMFVTERGMAGFGVSGGAAGSVSIRGVGGGNKVLFLIDGQPQWAGVFGHSLADTYVANDVQRVEVVSGPSSLLYGSGAMGGSVNLITRRAGSDGFEGSVRAQGGSYGTLKSSARGGYKKGGLRTYAAASYERSDGNRRGMDYWLSNQYASIGYDFSKHWEAGADVMLTETKADNPGECFREHPLDMWAKQFRTSASVFVKNRYDVSSGGIQFYGNWGTHDIDDGLDSSNRPRDFLFHSKDYNMGVTLYQTIRPWSGNDLSAGVDFKHWGGRTYNTYKQNGVTIDSPSTTYKAHVNEIAGYAMMQQSLLSDVLSVNAGVRLEHSSQFGNEWVPQAGFILRPLRSNRLKFSYGKGFRSPSMRELYMYPPHNPDLMPEKMYNLEVELRQWLFNRRFCAGLSLFYINGDNLIQTVREGGRPLNVNTGKFINKGFELDVTYTPDAEWSFTANYAYLHTDKLIVAAPKNKVFAEASFTPGRWQFSVDVQGIWSLKTSAVTTDGRTFDGTSENYALLNARAAYSFDMRRPLTIFAKGENLTAARYQIYNGFPMPRATFSAGLEWSF